MSGPRADDGLYRRVVESLDDYAVIVMDAGRRVVTWNRGAEKLLGYSAAEMVGGPADVIFTPEDVAAGAPVREAEGALATGQAEDNRWHVRKDGTRFWASGVLSRLADDGSGSPATLVKVLRDQTALRAALAERAETDEALRASELRFRRLLEANILGTGISSRDGAWVEMNDALLRLLGYTRTDLRAGRVRWDRMTPPEYRPRDERGMAEARERGACTPYEKEYVRADGSRVPVLIGYAPVSGVDDHFVCFVLDLTTQKRVERELRASEERLRSVFEAMAEGFCLVEPVFDAGGNPVDYRYLLANPALERHTGLRDIVGKTARGVMPHHEQEWVDGYARVALTGEPFRREGRVEDLGRWYEVSAVRVGDPESRQVGVVFRDVTDRHRAAEAVRASERQLADIFRHAPSFMAVLRGPAHVFERVNDRYAELVSGRELIGRPVREALPEVVPQGFVDLLDGVYRTGEPFVGAGTRVLLDPGGGRPLEERVLDFVYQPLTDPGGAVAGVLVHGVDLTDRVRAQERLRDNEAWLQTVTDTLPALVGYVDAGLVYRFVNRAYEEWFGTPAAAVVGKTVREVLGAEHFGQRRPHLEAALRGETVRFEAPTDHARLGRRETELVYTPYRPGGAVAGFFVHGVDITERRAVERARREAERRLDLAVEVAQMGTFEIDLATDAVAVNEPGRAIYGWDGVHTTFARVQTHFHPDDRDRVLAAVAEALNPAGPGTFEVEQRILRTDRAERWIRVRGRALFAGAGADSRAVRCIGAYLDVTEAKRREDALREADRRKDEFLALLAHELRNPLAPLRNGLQVLRLAGGPADTARRAREMMDRQLTHLVRLVDDLLDVSRITRGKLDLRRERVALADVLASAVETAKPALDAAGHALTVSVPEAPLYLDGDLTRLAQVFANLLTNSAKYTPPGGDVRLAVARDGGDAVVRVTDNGSGIPPDSLPRIFDMFNQVDRLIERTSGGLGIGLALVKGLVEMHGGTVAAASEGEGRGSTFTVRLPLSPQQPPPSAPVGSANGVTATGPGRRVLVVDDNRDSAHSMADMLKLLGHDVRTAHDGTDAVVVAEAFRPDLILMDVGMPTMNGLDATRAVRGRPWGRDVTIVALTGWGQEADRSESRRAGCDDHLVKPVALETLAPFLSAVQPP